MKGFLAGIVVTAPVTCLLLFVVMQSRYDTITRIERSQIHQKIQAEQFDNDFDRAWSDLSPSSPSKLDKVKAKEQKRREKIAALKARQKRFDDQFDDQFDQIMTDTEDLRDAMRAAGKGKEAKK